MIFARFSPWFILVLQYCCNLILHFSRQELSRWWLHSTVAPVPCEDRYMEHIVKSSSLRNVKLVSYFPNGLLDLDGAYPSGQDF